MSDDWNEAIEAAAREVEANGWGLTTRGKTIIPARVRELKRAADANRAASPEGERT